MEVPYVVVNRINCSVVLCTSKKAVAKVLGLTYDGLRKRGFGKQGMHVYKDWVVWLGVEIERQKKGFGG